MLISIIIPIYNVEKYIKECLESVYQQTYPNIEIILVNDCTPDASVRIAQSIISKYSNKFPTTIIHHKQNMGLSEARNSGMKVAKGDYIYFIDSDDTIIPEAINLLAQFAIKYYGTELIIGETLKCIEANNYTKIKINKQEITKKYTQKNSQIYYLSNGKRSICNTLFKRFFLEQHSIYFKSGLIYEDNLFKFCIANHVSSLIVLEQVTYLHRQNNLSLTMNITEKHMKSITQIVSYISQQLSKDKHMRKAQLIYLNKFIFTFWTDAFMMQKDIHHKYFQCFYTYSKFLIQKHYQEMRLKDIFLHLLFCCPYNLANFLFRMIQRKTKLT